LKHYVQKTLGIQTLATGHYARVLNNANSYGNEDHHVKLLRAADNTKDQSYFLSMTPGHLFEDVLFPLGELTKKEVRVMTKDKFAGLNVLQKRESMGICFIGKRPMKEFLSNYINLTSGRFVDYDTGKILGTHEGLEYYTLGQGAKISGVVSKYYIVEKHDPIRQISSLGATKLQRGDILVAEGHEHPALLRETMQINVDQFNWISGYITPSLLLGNLMDLQFKARYTQVLQNCTVRITTVTSEFGTDTTVLAIKFAVPQRALTPGQIFVLYDKDQCLGGAVI